jgi:FkbH-like protein
MSLPPEHLALLLNATSSAEMRGRLSPRRASLTLAQVVDLTRRLQALQEHTVPVRLGFVHTYTSELLDPYLRFEAALQGLQAEIYHAPYGVTLGETEAGSGLRAHAPDLTVLLLRWEDLHPALGEGLGARAGESRRSLLDEVVAALTALVSAFRSALGGQLLVTLLPPMVGPGAGICDVNAQDSETTWRADLKAAAAARLNADFASVTMLDLDDLVADIGRRHAFDARWWYTSRFPFTPEAARELSRRIVAFAAVLKLPRAKVIAVDADNTMWGGIIGEDGLNGIALGPEYPGNAFVDFQRRLLDYQQRGFLLVLCSKNNPEDVQEVLRRHPHQILREDSFAAMRVNWETKAGNLQAIAEELNLGLDSFLLVDDSEHEGLMVRQTLPAVEVVRVPERPVDIPGCLDAVARLEVLSITAEDRRRTAMYAEARRRQQTAQVATDVDSYLRSLEMRMVVGLDDLSQVPRISQLTLKTNQFNLTTRRYSEAEIRAFMESRECLVAHFSVADIFGDSGIVGVAVVRVTSPGVAELDDFLMSCRVIGRRAESAFLETVLSLVRQRGTQTVLADYVPTAKNKLAERFLGTHGFRPNGEGRLSRDLAAPAPAAAANLPITVDVAVRAPRAAQSPGPVGRLQESA